MGHDALSRKSTRMPGSENYASQTHKRTIFCELFPSKTVSTSQAKYVYDEGSKIYFSRLFIGL